MYRVAMEDLIAWKNSRDRKPLIIRGARQVGKTWLMKEFGNGHYEKCIYINFDGNTKMQLLFQNDLDIPRIMEGIELISDTKIDPSNTLLIFDEIQEVPRALTSLKYFNENAPEYSIICAGSLLGVALHPGTSFPVGKVDFLDLYPLNFVEFLMATGSEKYVALLDKNDFEMLSVFRNELTSLLKQYFIIGGMPESVLEFSKNRDYYKAREIQNKILLAYEQDFSKHAPNETVPRKRSLWNSVASQLAKENKKFIYGLIKEGARAKEYELAMMWLIDCGLLIKVSRVSMPSMPLKAYEDPKAFKLFLLDVGLLGALAALDLHVYLDNNRLFSEFKGALAEQYVLQQMQYNHRISTYYWSNDRGTAEIDFVIQCRSAIVPIEVKAETNLQAKSLKTFKEKFTPEISIRMSMSDYKKEDWLINLPLYAASQIEQQIGGGQP